MKYHLLHDFGVYKSTLKRNFYDNDRPAEYDDIEELLQRRTQYYTLEEIKRLGGFLWTAHDDCVSDNPDDYNPLQVHTARQKIENGLAVFDKIKALEQKELT